MGHLKQNKQQHIYFYQCIFNLSLTESLDDIIFYLFAEKIIKK